MFSFCRGPKPTVLNNSITSKSQSQNPVWTNGDLAQPVLLAGPWDTLKKTYKKHPRKPLFSQNWDISSNSLLDRDFTDIVKSHSQIKKKLYSDTAEKSVFKCARYPYLCSNICWIKLLAPWAVSCLLGQAGLVLTAPLVQVAVNDVPTVLEIWSDTAQSPTSTNKVEGTGAWP